jgi:hypothetical protein
VKPSSSSLVRCALTVALVFALAACGGSRDSVTRSEFVNAVRRSGLGPIRIIDNRAAGAKVAREFRRPDLEGGWADEILVVSALARDPSPAHLYAVRFADSRAAKVAMTYGNGNAVRVCNVVLLSAASKGTADRRRFDRLISTIRKRC